jgi:hypothetical protein
MYIAMTYLECSGGTSVSVNVCCRNANRHKCVWSRHNMTHRQKQKQKQLNKQQLYRIIDLNVYVGNIEAK